MRSSLHCLIPFLSLFCSCQLRRLDSIQFLCSQARIPTGWDLETRLDYNFTNEFLFLTTLHGPRRKHSLSIVGKACLQRRCIAESYSIVACVFVAAGIYLPSRCLTMNVYSDFSIPAFGFHVTISCIYICSNKK
jgi:hypothetical protein